MTLSQSCHQSVFRLQNNITRCRPPAILFSANAQSAPGRVGGRAEPTIRRGKRSKKKSYNGVLNHVARHGAIIARLHGGWAGASANIQFSRSGEARRYRRAHHATNPRSKAKHRRTFDQACSTFRSEYYAYRQPANPAGQRPSNTLTSDHVKGHEGL